MKLYIYDHCPFCTRARLALAHYGYDVENMILANDDEATPIALIGAKQVPILQQTDGTAMGESLDIVRYAAANAGKDFDENVRPQVQAWFERVNGYYNHLTMPRAVRLGLPEFAEASAIAYYVAKKEQFIGSFAENLAQTESYLKQIHADLAELNAWVASADALNGTGFSMEDVLVFPLLRNLTMVNGICFPEKVADYAAKMSKTYRIDLYHDRAV